MKTVDVHDETKKAEDTLLLAAASTPALSRAFKQRHYSTTIDANRKDMEMTLSDDKEQGGQGRGISRNDLDLISCE